RTQHWENVIQHLLSALLLRVERNVRDGQMLPVFPGWRRVYPTGGLPSLPASDKPDARPSIQRVLAYIQSHLHEPLSLPGIAAWACVSPPHLSRLFRTQVGTSVMEYVTRCRIASARHYLTHAPADLTIREISQLVGFQDASYFARVFKKRVHLSPEDFRRQHGGPSASSDSP
ncbi:MAG TPA: AraC family transcriptional regulator, partial [Chthonomonadaceae bacterium]|nr:AraC family transcriptional regulator [Chthonomonadaceae bacterium]